MEGMKHGGRRSFVPLPSNNMHIRSLSSQLSKMAAPPPAAGFASKNRVAILAELDKEKRKLLLQNQSSTNNPGASIALARPNVNKDFRDHAEQQHIAAQQKAALQHAHAHSTGYFITQDSAFGNLILPVIPRLEAE
ncbi:SOSS complex subunit C [Leptodactylus fuscus]|uniref:SOSS complex subunit C n=1 Tax=Leptodactylus fuscus TaxID=238119 RepID=UPI003F4E6C6B